jgi:hypothetical protein
MNVPPGIHTIPGGALCAESWAGEGTDIKANIRIVRINCFIILHVLISSKKLISLGFFF